MANELVLYDAMCQAIAEAYEVDEVKEIRNKAIAFAHYQRLANNVEAETQCCEIRLRAERKLGQLLAEMPKAKGARGHLAGRDASGGTIVEPPEDDEETLDDMGITKRQSSQWQTLARIPEDQFNAALADPGRPTTTGIINAVFPRPVTPVSDEALWLWGRLNDFKTDGLLNKDPGDVLATMTEEMIEDVYELSPLVSEWLSRIRKGIH